MHIPRRSSAARLARRLSSAAAPPPLQAQFAATTIPHPEKVHKGGEDACWASAASGWFGVADGVGGSAKEGVDPGKFSRGVLAAARDCVAGGDAAAGGEGPTEALRRAAAVLLPQKLPGSSTVLLGSVDPSSATLRIANIGDCSALLLRPAVRSFGDEQTLYPRVVLQVHAQQHYFNCPYQVSTGTFAQALEHQCDEVSCAVEHGDVVIAATDGVFDNLDTSSMQLEVARLLPRLLATAQPKTAAAEQQEAEEARAAALRDLAKAIAEKASEIGLRQDDSSIETPFSAGARREGLLWPGGKTDDIAVVVGMLVTAEGSESLAANGAGEDVGNLDFHESSQSGDEAAGVAASIQGRG